jgi:hypothetical protein
MKKLKPLEAFNMTLQRIKELESLGICVSIKPIYEDSSGDIFCHDRIGIPPSKWIYVRFEDEYEDQLSKIIEAETEFRMLGVFFNVANSGKFHFWYLDHSFKVVRPAGLEDFK